jgi:hypothetical protein
MLTLAQCYDQQQHKNWSCKYVLNGSDGAFATDAFGADVASGPK